MQKPVSISGSTFRFSAVMEKPKWKVNFMQRESDEIAETYTTCTISPLEELHIHKGTQQQQQQQQRQQQQRQQQQQRREKNYS